jgi:predicted dehydrogenase
MTAPIKLIVLGAGNRGTVYGDFALAYPQQVQVVALAEPREDARLKFALAHHLPDTRVVADWRSLQGISADAVVIATPDQEHLAPALHFAAQGYHLLLEKPMAPTEAECREIVSAVKKAGVIMAVGHVLRYTPYTQTLRRLLDEGMIGEVISLQHLEPVGYWHQAHSYVRGNWRNETTSSSMLLAKSCHDLDWIRYIMGESCEAVSSFGTLSHFKKEHKPGAAGAAMRCLDCAFERECPYSAKRFYLGLLERGELGMPLTAVTLETTYSGVIKALETGPYGRCVYECDNDVVDHQVVNMRFQSGKTASFTMTAFTLPRPRITRIFGTRGEIYGDSETIKVTEFLGERTYTVDIPVVPGPSSVVEGHGGGDVNLLKAFITALQTGDARFLLSGPDETLESHLIVFAAERARRSNSVEPVTLSSASL